MKRGNFNIRLQMLLSLGLILVCVWVGTIYELHRSRNSYLSEAEVRTAVQAQVFAEYSRSTLKRINEFILDVRTRWTGDWESFSVLIERTKENIDDLTFQVAVIDKDGLMAYSNLAKSTDRTDLSKREHFRVHRQAPDTDQLFVSRPLMGKVSGKWSIQMTRPIINDNQFNGVLVVSISPDQFAGFGAKLRLSGESVMTLVRDSGEIMARYPSMESSLGRIISNRIFLEANSPLSGNYRQLAYADGTDRIFGYYKLPEYGMNFVVGESVSDVLIPYNAHRRLILGAALAVSVLSIGLFFMLFRSLASQEEVRGQLKAIFALSPDGFVSFDEERRVKYVSPAFLNMTGISEATVVGADEGTFSRLLASECKKEARFIGIASLRSALPVAGGDLAASQGHGASEKRQLIELTGVAPRILEVCLRVSDAETVSQILYFRDVTHETEVDRMKSEFLSHAAHELRTPMASIYGFSELLLEMELDEPTRRDLMETIHRQTRWLVDIINELLDLARIEARQGKDFKIEDVDLKTLLQDTLSDLSFDLERWPVSLDLTPEIGLVRADSAKFRQALVNLLNNAQKYSPEGGGIQLAIVTKPGSLGVAVSDKGIGLSAEQIKHIGERFWRADTSGKIPGTGLGMAIVKEILQHHGGHIEVSSQPGAGTTVTLWLPSHSSDRSG